MAIDKHCGIHRARRRPGNAINSKPRFLEQTIKHAPRECPMRAAALQRKIDKDWIASDGGLSCFNRHWTSQKTTSARPTYRQVSAMPVALSLAIDGTAIATNPKETRNALCKAAAEVAERRKSRGW